MGTARASNKDILDALDAGFDRLITALTANAVSPPTYLPKATSTSPAAPATDTIKVDPEYLDHMNLKAAEHATNKGEEVVLYGRRNKAGEQKLAYALRSRFDEVVAKQPSCNGAIASYQP